MYRFCNNCGKIGHLFKQCRQPITSYGFIVFHKGPDGKDPLKYLFIKRKHSISYIEFIRGRYIYEKNNKTCIDTKYVNYLFINMTRSERLRLITDLFEDLWDELWSFDKKTKKFEFNEAQDKFNLLKKGIKLNNKTLSLEYILSQTSSIFEDPEWGFPKGRKNQLESEIDTAYREFQEETNFPITCLK